MWPGQRENLKIAIDSIRAVMDGLESDAQKRALMKRTTRTEELKEIREYDLLVGAEILIEEALGDE